MGKWDIVNGDVIEWAENYGGPQFHSLLSDPPYHLTSIVKRFGKNGSKPAKFGKDGAFGRASKGFMGKQWDGGDLSFRPETWELICQHLYPGAFGMVFASSRGWHRVACALEDAGMIIHPTIFCWANGAGFPKATRIDTQIGNLAGAEREIEEREYRSAFNSSQAFADETHSRPVKFSKPTTQLAKDFEGYRYGAQAMKPAVEPIIVFQKPYEERPVDSIAKTGAGALNIDGARIGVDKVTINRFDDGMKPFGNGAGHEYTSSQSSGRWPANFVLQHSSDCKRIGNKTVRGITGTKNGSWRRGHQYSGGWQGASEEELGEAVGYADENGMETVEEWECVEECPVRKLGDQSGKMNSRRSMRGVGYNNSPIYGNGDKIFDTERGFNDSGTATRFFFNANWNYEVAERLENSDPVKYVPKANRVERDAGLDGRCEHPTVKPIALSRWLATLLLPPASYAPRRLLTPFSGVSSEMIGAILSGWDYVLGIEGEKEYVDIAEARLKHWISKTEEQLEMFK